MSVIPPIRRTLLAATAIAALVALPAFAHPISSAFDGVYAGSSRLQKPLSQASCPASIGYKLTIHDGSIRGQADDGSRIRGFVTSSGFFTGRDRLPDGTRTPFEGSVKNGKLVGGLFKDHTCASVVVANKQ